jgi:hypothetical protein
MKTKIANEIAVDEKWVKLSEEFYVNYNPEQKPRFKGNTTDWALNRLIFPEPIMFGLLKSLRRCLRVERLRREKQAKQAKRRKKKYR